MPGGPASDRYTRRSFDQFQWPSPHGHGRRARRRLWRHRHQPALCAEGSGQGGRPWRAAHVRRDPRGGVADPVGADPDHFTQIRAVDPARRQSRRRRHRRIAGAAFRPQRPAGNLARPAPDRRPGRRGVALWRRRHHTGDLGPERDRRREGRCPLTGACRGAADHHHPDRAVHHSEEGRGLYRQDLRAGDAGLVPGDRACSASMASCARPACSPR